MRNFNEVSATTRSPTEMNAIIIIEDCFNLKLSIQNYIRLAKQGIDLKIPKACINDCLFGVIFDCSNILQRNLQPGEYEKIVLDSKSSDFEVLYQVTFKILDILDKVKLRRIDLYEHYDSTRTLEEDKVML